MQTYIAFGIKTIDQIYYQSSFFFGKRIYERVSIYFFGRCFLWTPTRQTLCSAWRHTLTNELWITRVHVNSRISTTNLQHTSGFVLLTEKQYNSISKKQSESIVNGAWFQLLWRHHQVHPTFGTLDQRSTLLFFIFVRISRIWRGLFASFSPPLFISSRIFIYVTHCRSFLPSTSSSVYSLSSLRFHSTLHYFHLLIHSAPPDINHLDVFPLIFLATFVAPKLALVRSFLILSDSITHPP